MDPADIKNAADFDNFQIEILKGLSISERLQRQEGTFFTPMESIWEPEEVCIDKDRWRDIKRSPAQGEKLYPEIVSDENLSLDEMESTGSRSSATNRESNASIKFDMFYNGDPEAAHLISNAPRCSKAYGFIVEFATGKETNKEGRGKLLNGVKSNRNEAKRQRTDTSSRTSRKRKTGLKHHEYNKMLLKNQRLYYGDSPPRIIIIPLLQMSEILAWDGISTYEVLAVTCGERPRSAAEEILKYAMKTCSLDDIELGRTVLETFLKGIASSVQEHDVAEHFQDQQKYFLGTRLWPNASHDLIVRRGSHGFQLIGQDVVLFHPW